MGLFRSSKDKDKKHLAPETQVQDQNVDAPTSSTPSPAPAPTSTIGHKSQPSNVSTTDQSYRDSAYYTNSNASSAETRPREHSYEASQNQNHNQNRNSGGGPAPGTTVTTTTTTTTTTVTVAPDGSMHTSSHPYNPTTDPPPEASETTLNSQRQNEIARSSGERPQTQAIQQPQPQRREQAHTEQHHPPAQQARHTRNDERVASPLNRNPITSNNPPATVIIPPTPPVALSHQNSYSPEMPSGSSIPHNEYNNHGIESQVTPPARSELRSGSKFEMEDTSPTQPPSFPERSSRRNSGSPMENVAIPLPRRTSQELQQKTQASYAPCMRSRSREHINPPIEPASYSSHQEIGHDTGYETTHYPEPNYDSEYATALTPAPNGPTPGLRRRTSSNLRLDAMNSPSSTQTPITSPSIPPTISSQPHNQTTPTHHQPNISQQHNSSNTPQSYTPVSPTTSSSINPTTTTITAAPERKKTSLSGAFRGIRGASEALRGTVNQGIAKGLHDKEEEVRMREVRAHGMEEFRDSGLREDLKERQMKYKNRKAVGGTGAGRGNGVYGSEGPGGLDSVEERSVRSLETR